MDMDVHMYVYLHLFMHFQAYMVHKSCLCSNLVYKRHVSSGTASHTMYIRVRVAQASNGVRVQALALDAQV